MARTKKPSKKQKAPAPKRDLYQEITDRIVGVLESGDVAPWHRPWKVDAFQTSMPRNVRGNPYRGVNVWLTLCTAWSRGYQSNVWLTFKQANEFAGRAMRDAGREVEQDGRGTWVFADGSDKGRSCGGIRKGQNRDNGCGGTDICFWKPTKYRAENEEGEEEQRRGLVLKFYLVFNLEQCDQHVIDFVSKQQADAMAKRPTFNPIEACEKICAGYDVATRHGGDEAFYSVTHDRIQLPKPETFRAPEHYYTTRFHEMGHSTGAVHRLNRKGIASFDGRGSHQYSEEELVAEFCACFLAGEAGIERTTESESASYLKMWAAKLKEDPKCFVMAAQRAQKAADLILGREQQSENAADAAA